MKNNITQDQVNEMFVVVNEEWQQMVANSGQSEPMFIILNSDKRATQFLYHYQLAKEEVEKSGLVMPELVKGLLVTHSDPE